MAVERQTSPQDLGRDTGNPNGTILTLPAGRVAAAITPVEIGPNASTLYGPPNPTIFRPTVEARTVTLPVREPSRVNRPLSMALAGLVALGGTAALLYLSNYGGSSAPPRENTPASDTLKPPPDSTPAISVVVSPPPSVEPVQSTPPLPEKPKINPVDAAIKAGKIELKEPEEWKKYFELVSADQARTMLEAEKAKGNTNAFLLPLFDLSGVTKGFTMVERIRIIPRSGKPFEELLISGLSIGTRFYSNYDGGARPGAAGIIPPVTEISGVSKEGVAFILVLPRIAGKNGITLGEFRTPNDPAFPVEIGTQLDEINTTNIIPDDYGVPGHPQAWFFMRTQKPDGSYDHTGARLTNALRSPSGKFILAKTVS